VIEEIVKKIVPANMITRKTRFLINPTGRFVVGGPQGDCGVTGRKIIVDTYGGMGRHGGGAFSGKDPSKVDRSAAYMARYIAKNVVAARLASRCEVQVAYAIGFPDPVSIHVDTFGTGTVADEAIENAIPRVFGLKPAEIIKGLDLLRPIYRGDLRLRPLRPQLGQGPQDLHVGTHRQGRGAPRRDLTGAPGGEGFRVRGSGKGLFVLLRRPLIGGDDDKDDPPGTAEPQNFEY